MWRSVCKLWVSLFDSFYRIIKIVSMQRFIDIPSGIYIAEAILKKYEPDALLTPTRIEPETIAQQMGLQIEYESITKDASIFGQVYF